MTRARVRPFYGWLMVGGLGLTELVSWGVPVYAFSVLVVPMRDELNWSTAELNAAYATGVVISGLLAVPVGWVLQSYGARRDDHRHGGPPSSCLCCGRKSTRSLCFSAYSRSAVLRWRRLCTNRHSL